MQYPVISRVFELIHELLVESRQTTASSRLKFLRTKRYNRYCVQKKPQQVVHAHPDCFNDWFIYRNNTAQHYENVAKNCPVTSGSTRKPCPNLAFFLQFLSSLKSPNLIFLTEFNI